MNVLLIAPDGGLAGVADEVRAVSALLRAVSLVGTVSRRDVLDTLDGHKWDVIWFACHSDERGVLLSDGVMPTSDLTAIVRSSGAYLLVLNSCSTRWVGLEVHYELGIAVVCAVADVDDRTAYQHGALLARNLANGLSVEDAFERARPGQQQMFFLFVDRLRSDENEEVRTIRMLNEWGSKLNRRIDEMERRFMHEIEGVREEVRSETRQIKVHMTSAVQLTPTHSAAFVVAFVLLFAPVPLFYVQVRDMVGISWSAALSIAALCYGVSALLWRYMWYGSKGFGGD